MKMAIKYSVYVVGSFLVFYFLVAYLKSPEVPLPQNQSTAGQFEWTVGVNVYFVDREKAKTSSCEADVAIKRQVPNAESLGLGSLEALINGLLPDEEKLYYSAINKNTLIQKFEIKNKVAYVDFNSDLNKGVAGSCTVIAIRSQIERTLTDLPDIDSVVISVNGQTEGILEP
jgi:spore germination protein GerM